MKQTLLFLLALGWAIDLSAQNEICFTYDAAGNRIKRQSCCTNCSLTGPTENRDQQQAAPLAVEKWTIVPNPSTGVFTLTGQDIPPSAQVFILDLAGRVIQDRPLGDGHFEVRELPPGAYLVALSYNGIRRTLLLEKINP